MKKLAGWCVVLAVVCGAVAWGLNLLGGQDPGFMVGYALGNPHDGHLEMHVVVSIPMIRNEGLGSVRLADGTHSQQTWDEWIAQHFRVFDESGRTVTFRRAGFSSLISDQRANNPEFFLEGQVRAGATYTFDYIPFSDSTLCFRSTFTVPPEGQPFKRGLFKTTYEG